MKGKVSSLHDWIERRLREGRSISFVAGTLITVPIGIMMISFLATDFILSESFKPKAALVWTLVLTLLFPLVMVTFGAVQKMNVIVTFVKQSMKFDDLTRVLSRLHFLELTPDCDADGYIFIVQPDHFGRIRSTYGHAAADAVLIDLAHSVELVTATFGQVGRLSEEQFGVFLPRASRGVAEKIAKDIRSYVEHRPISVQGMNISLTVSIGAAAYIAELPLYASLAAVETQLLRAKEWGLNTIAFEATLLIPDQTRRGIPNTL